MFDSARPLLEEVAAGREADLQVINASVEQLTGPDRLWAFGLVGPDNQPVRDADVAVWVGDGPDANGPFPTTFRDIPNQPLGLYATRIDVATPGDTPVVAVLADGTAAGYTTLRAVDPADSVAPAPGDPAVRVQTPTDQEHDDRDEPEATHRDRPGSGGGEHPRAQPAPEQEPPGRVQGDGRTRLGHVDAMSTSRPIDWARSSSSSPSANGK